MNATTPPLEAELDRAVSAFMSAAHALRSFVMTSQAGLQHQVSLMAGISEKIAAAKAGRPAPDPGPDAVEIGLTEDQVELLERILQRQGDLAVQFPSMLLDMALIYIVALFDAYVGDVLQAVLRGRPEMMRSGRQLTYETILSYEDRESLIEAMAAREIHEITHKSLAAQLRYYEDRFGIVLTGAADVEVESLVELVARRNLLVHNAGVVNAIYLDAVSSPAYALGERVTVEQADWESAVSQFETAVKVIDAHLRSKFLPKQALPSPSAPATAGDTGS